MKLRELLTLIQGVGQENDIESWICGGTPRDRVLHILEKEVADIDITTGDRKVFNLAEEVALELKKSYNISVRQGEDGHKSIIFPGNKFKLDFSSNFQTQGIEKILFAKGIKLPTDLQKEIFSRDFTCNTLLLDLALTKIKDPTHMGIRDIKAKILKTCLAPEITLSVNKNRIIRIIYLAAKLDFDVDENIIKFVSQHKDLIKTSSDHYIKKNLDKAMAKNPERAVHLIKQMDLWDVLPMTESLAPYRNKKSVAQLKRNFDIGEGLYSQLDKYKSVSDFRKKRRGKRKKILQKIRDMKLK
jgi:poly(A) polymerase